MEIKIKIMPGTARWLLAQKDHDGIIQDALFHFRKNAEIKKQTKNKKKQSSLTGHSKTRNIKF